MSNVKDKVNEMLENNEMSAEDIERIEKERKEKTKRLKLEKNFEEKVELHTVSIPIDPLNPKIDKLPIFINDKRYDIPLGKQVAVNTDVYEILKQTGYAGEIEEVK